MSPSSRSSRRKCARRGAAIAVLTASTILSTTEGVLAQTNPTASAGLATSPDTRRFQIQIATGSLADGLERFTAQTGIRIVPGTVALSGRQSPAVSGSLTATDALRALLAGSGIAFSFISTNAVALTAAPVVIGGVMALPAVQVKGQTTAPGSDPYADPVAPYKADRLSSSKFTEPILNTPRTATVLTSEALDDENATKLREIGRSTAGVTLGSGEGGFAFGDRFFIRGFDARNDVFVDGVRDPGVSIRENFDTDQVEILRGPGSTYAGRGTTGGAINIATKQAGDVNFFEAEATLGFTDAAKRATIDFNHVLGKTFSVRVNGMVQGAHIAGRNFATDNRNGIAGAVKYQPSDNFTVKADYSHTYLNGLPDFGVPYDPVSHRPVTEGIVPGNTYYGIVNRDFTKTTQDMGTLDATWKAGDAITLENTMRKSRSILNYIGTIPENPSAIGATAPFSSTPTFFSGYTQLNAQSRYETSSVLTDQPQAIFKFTTGSVRHAMIVGGEFANEGINIDSYAGFTSELTTGPVAFTSTGAPIVSVYNPINYLFGAGVAHLTGNPLQYRVNTNAGFIIDTATLSNQFILNAGIRYDDYVINASNNASARANHSGITSYNWGAVYKPAKTGSIYVAYATGSDPVGDELDATSSAYGGFAATQNPTQIFGPQLSRAVEVGTKWELAGGHLLATASAFQTNVTNARETAPAGLPGYAASQIVAGAAYRVKGLDFELAGNLTGKISLTGGLVLLDTYIQSSIVPTNVGLNLANIAPQSFNLLAKYALTPKLSLGGGAIYVSSIKGGSLLAANGGVAYPNPPNPTILPEHWRFDFSTEAYLSEHVELKLFVQNILNKTYYDSLYQSAVPFVAVAPGRSISLEGEFKL